MRRILIILFSSVVLLVLTAMLALYLFMHSAAGQSWLAREYVDAMAEEAGTVIKAGKIYIDVSHGELELHDVYIEDQKKVPMLQVDTLEMNINMTSLFSREIAIKGVKLHGARAILYKETKEGPTNYQFFLDAFKKKSKGHKDKKITSQRIKTLKKIRFVWMLRNVDFDRMDFTWDVKDVPLKGGEKLDMNHLKVKEFRAHLSGDILSKKTATLQMRDFHVIEQLSRMNVDFGFLNFNGKNNDFAVTIKRLALKIDKKRPHRRTRNPKRGFFDEAHVNLTADIALNGSKVGKDSLVAEVIDMKATDHASGLKVKGLKVKANISKSWINLHDLKVDMPKTHLEIKDALMKVTSAKNKVHPKDPSFQIVKPIHVTARTVLTDIARPFAPVLSDFTTPLNLTVDLAGNDKKFFFQNIHVTTPDKRINIKGQGNMALKMPDGSKGVVLHFSNLSMTTRGGVKEQIVGHFSKKIVLKMQRQMKKMGNISYRNGRVDIQPGLVTVQGRVLIPASNPTHPAPLDFSLAINSDKRTITASGVGDSIDVGTILNVKGLKPVSLKADVVIVNDKRVKRKKGDHGRLPIGTVEAEIFGLKYKGIGVKRTILFAKSNGTDAEGEVTIVQKFLSPVVTFKYHQTKENQKLTYKVSLKKTLKDQALKEEKKKEKEAKKEAKRLEKEAKKEVKRLEKEIKKQEKEARKQAKKLEKQARL